MAAFNDDIWGKEKERENLARAIAFKAQCHEIVAKIRSTDSSQVIGLEFAIASKDVDKVIGERATKIRELELLTGASINVVTSDSEPMIKIYGSAGAQKHAKELIEETIGSKITVSKKIKGTNQSLDWAKVRENMKIQEERLARFEKQMPITKDFYYEHPEVTHMSPKHVDELRKSMNNIMITPLKPEDKGKIPNPVETFYQAFEKYPEILRKLHQAGFKSPSPIQCQAWPVLLQGHNLVGIAQTGTDKTIAFLLPAFIHIENQIVPRDKRVGPTCLILAPTRELALQIFEETKKYAYKGIRSVCIYGGGSKRDHIAEVKKGVEIVIATPGRLLDLLASEVLNLVCVTYLVLDEADRMLDLGYEKQIKSVVHHIRPDRQTVMTSATWSAEVQSLVAKYMDNPIKMNIGSVDQNAAHSVEQKFVFIDDEDERRQHLFSFIDRMDSNDKLLVFVEKKAVVDDLASDIVLRYDRKCGSIHGDREQSDREQVLDFETGYTKVLVTTDVASRGLDVKAVTHVFNMNMPRDIEDYVHRIERSGCAGKSGVAVTIICHQDRDKATELIQILRKAGQNVPPVLERMAERHQKRLQNRPDYKRRGCVHK